MHTNLLNSNKLNYLKFLKRQSHMDVLYFIFESYIALNCGILGT